MRLLAKDFSFRLLGLTRASKIDKVNPELIIPFSSPSSGSPDWRGLFFSAKEPSRSRSQRPTPLRIIVFIDGQNLYNDCRRTFGKGEAHPHLLAQELCSARFGEDRQLVQVRFYTGIHSPNRNPRSNAYMNRRLGAMKARGIWTFARPLKYSLQWVKNKEGPPEFVEIMQGREKGVDVRLALDLFRLAVEGKYDIAVLASTDTDLDEAVRDVLRLRQTMGRWLAVENAVCVGPVDPDGSLGRRRPPYKRLSSASRLLHIDQKLFDRIRDDTDYWRSDIK